ncbi:hypothetical protein [Candidatus Tisiphia endosymbiont of Sialis lutaria]|uniref:hypothetical protein n=1 Tax=Candidatus Tisiphia endosymbiont of Sialis lutaria TaxID=2029164 RepID=UPI00312CA9B8
MTNNDQNQQQVKEIINLHKLQPELIEARITLTKVLKTLCANDELMQKVYDYSGDIVNSGEVGDVVTSRRLPTITN